MEGHSSLASRCKLGLDFRRIVSYVLQNITGGIQYNAIPRETEVVIAVKDEDKQKVLDAVRSYQAIYANEYRITDPFLDITIEESPSTFGFVLTDETKRKIIDYLYFSDNGVIRMDANIPDTVESSINLGTIHLDENYVIIQIMTRNYLESIYTTKLFI